MVTVDVFAENKYAGNQLAVVLNADGLSTEQMQAITLEMNYSETTFVISQSADRARVRIFTLSSELPFAGHPTIGTAWVLGREQNQFTLELNAGDVPVVFEKQSEICWMTPPKAEMCGLVDNETAAAIAGLQAKDMLTDTPNQVVDIGPCFLIAGVNDLETLQRAQLNPEALQAFQSERHPQVCLFLFSRQAYSGDADYAVRMLFCDAGLREDPATGSANTGFATFLREHTGLQAKCIVEQGFEINRPSRIYLDVGEEIRVGGKVVQVISGELV